MAVLISKVYLMQLIFTEPSKYYSILKYPRLQELILKYGRPIEFIVIATALLLNSQSNEYFLLKFAFKML